MRVLAAALAAVVLLGVSGASAKKPSPAQIKQPPPEVDMDVGGEGGAELLEEIEVQDLVEAAMKTRTRVQEAPAIVTVITAKQMKDLGYRDVVDAIGQIPGFLRYDWNMGRNPMVGPQGVLQGALFMRDGLDLFDMAGINALNESLPIEMMRRIELISGPAGVLWGSNSFVGLINMVSKTADDLEGIEAYAGGGAGPGRPDAFRAYVMGGQKFFGGKLKVLAHVGYRTWLSPERELAYHVLSGVGPPSPLGPLTLSEYRMPEGVRSHHFIFDGNAQYGPIFARWSVPLSWRHDSIFWQGGVVNSTLPEDSIDCTNPLNKTLCQGRVNPMRLNRYNNQAYGDTQYGLVGYRDDFLDNKLKIEGRGFFLNYHDWVRAIFPSASGFLREGMASYVPIKHHRVGGSVDGTVQLPLRSTLLFGGEVFYDWFPAVNGVFVTDVKNLDLIPYDCPKNASGNYIKDSDGNLCPMGYLNETNRLTSGLFINAQTKIIPDVILDAGARVQFYGGKRSLEPVVLGSAGAVWTFITDWNLKVSYAGGFRPPALPRLDTTEGNFTWSGNPFLKEELSHAVQGEVNTRLLQGFKSIRRLNMRIDYSYIWLTNFVEIEQGQYKNASEIGIHSVEFLADLQMKQGHWFSLGYTFMDMSNKEKGKVRSAPNQWLSLRAVLNLWKKRLLLSSNLVFIGSMEDYNKIPNQNQPANPTNMGYLDSSGNPIKDPTYMSNQTDIVIDRIPPAAIWNAGLQFLMPQQGLRFAFNAYNLLNAKSYDGDYLMDQTAYMEVLPNPRPGFSFLLSVDYRM